MASTRYLAYRAGDEGTSSSFSPVPSSMEVVLDKVWKKTFEERMLFVVLLRRGMTMSCVSNRRS